MVRVPEEPPDTSQLVSLQTFIFTDGDDPELQRQGGECPTWSSPASVPEGSLFMCPSF